MPEWLQYRSGLVLILAVDQPKDVPARLAEPNLGGLCDLQEAWFARRLPFVASLTIRRIHASWIFIVMTLAVLADPGPRVQLLRIRSAKLKYFSGRLKT